jgi:hypothetical protein
MKVYSMPADLVELENRLRVRPGHEPPADLRDRVLRAAAESALKRQSSVERWNSWYWAAVAAAVLLVMNLSMVSALQTQYSVRPTPGANQLTAELQAMQQLEAEQEGTLK